MAKHDARAGNDSDAGARLYHSMLLIREVEEHVRKVYNTDVIKSPVHLSIGQESIAVGVCDALNPDDVISNTYRSHAGYIAKGGDLPQFMAELYGKIGGCAAGKAGSMHLVDMNHGIMGASAVVGTTVPVAAGYAFGLKRDARATKKQRVVVVFFGDGATEEGCVAETLNFAALHKLPILFLCENNGLAIHSKIERRRATGKLRGLAEAYGVAYDRVDDGDAFKIRAAAQKAVDQIRAGNGPVFLECRIYRWLEHVGISDDHNAPYRDAEQLKAWQAKDPIALLEKRLSPPVVSEIKARVAKELAEAVKFAEASPFPTTQEELMRCVYAA